MRDGTIVSNWYVATNLQAEGYDILLAYSKDDGKTLVARGEASS
jgi:hypothetical protein